MGKVLKPIAVVAAIAVNVIPGVGQALSAAIGTALAASVVTAVTTAGLTAGLGLAASALGLGPKSPQVTPAARDRLYANIDPATPRKWVFGNTALCTDIRYQEWTGEEQEYLHQIVHVASHRATSVDEIWLGDELAWTAAGGAQGKFAGYLSIDVRLEGNAGNTIAIGNGSKWGASRRLTGLAYLRMQFKLTGNGKKKESPFAQSIPSRMTIIGRASPVYDPRFDSTRGGNGPMRADDQSTWAFNYAGIDIGRNPANQLLTWLLGWRINGRLALGRGVPPARIDFASFITAANACDEPVALAAGGTEPRYRSDGLFTEADDPRGIIDTFEVTMNAKLRDAGGRFSLVVISNDLATPRFAFDDNDVLGEFRWTPTQDIERTFNEIRGKFVNPSRQALFQLVDYPRLRQPPTDGIERVHPLDLAMVQSGSQAQRIVKQQFARSNYQGRFEAQLGHRGWAVTLGDVVTLTFSALGWENRLFRVVEHGVRADGICPVVLQEEHPDIYLWDRDERPVVEPVELTPYDAAKSILMQLLVAGQIDYADGKTVEFLKPAEPGANVTETHTAANTAAVGYRTAAVLNALLSDIQTATTNLQTAQQQATTAINDLWNTVGRTTSQGLQSRIVSIESVNGGQATKITALESTLNTPTTGVLARLGTAENTIVTNNTAIATRVSAVESEITNARQGFPSLSAKFGQFAGTFVDQLNGRATVTAFESLSSEIVTARGGFSNLNANLSNLRQTTTDAIAGKASAESVTQLTASVGAQSSRITNVETVTADVAGRFNASVTLLLDAGGTGAAGFRINASNTVRSTFDLYADVTRFVAPGVAVVPFAVRAGGLDIRTKVNVYDPNDPNGLPVIEMGVVP